MAVHAILEDRRACLPPVVLTPLLSDPKLPKRIADLVQQLPVLDPKPGFLARAGTPRVKAMARKRKARLADTPIAQSRIDAGVALVTRVADFRNFTGSGDPKLLP